PSDMFEPLPAVIMIHEWWGLNDDVRATADRLAAEGFIVLAVDLFGGKTATSPTPARSLMLEVIENPELAEQNIRSAYEFVSSTAGAPKVGAIGWRFGATWSLNTALMFPDDLDATVIYYGPVTDDEEELRPVNSPILGLFAGKDISIKVESVEAFGASLERLRKDYDIQVYSGARQGFANPTSGYYDDGAASDAWQRTVEFLNRYLSDEDS
ncbi:MAG: dienelactone hydrolase family protein, partial [Woeseiaceae bacterium]